jgi:pyruvate kinase
MTESRAKIVCTIGPSSGSKAILFQLIKNGMDVARLNFSHGTHESHQKIIKLIREGSRKYKKPITILQDLQGIKIRVGLFERGQVELRKGSRIFIHPGEGTGDEQNIFVSYPSLLKDAQKGDRILLDDGLMQLAVTGKSEEALIARVIEGGILKDRKGVNLPGMKISLTSFTKKDRLDLELGIRMAVDCIAVSFVRNAEDIVSIRDWIRKKGRDLPLIAKIEKPEALLNIDEILDVSEGIMIARGDLGVEVPPEEVPLIQKELIRKANNRGRLVITATQMLESMKENPRPTRAEATDVANAVIDGTDALMLSAETASGRYPVQSYLMMDRIIRHTEQTQKVANDYMSSNSYPEALAYAAARAAEDIGAALLVAFTRSGFTARLVSKIRPKVPIIAFTSDKGVLSRLPLYWGVVPKYMRPLVHIDQLLLEMEKALLKENMVKTGDRIVIIASSPLSTRAKTNFLKLHQIGE